VELWEEVEGNAMKLANCYYYYFFICPHKKGERGFELMRENEEEEKN
jgi:hypothetical protein